MTVEGKITKHTYTLDGGGEYVYYKLNHNIILRMFIDKVAVVISPLWSEPLVLSESKELIDRLDKFIMGVDSIFTAPPMVIPENAPNSIKFIQELFKNNPYGLTRDDISFALCKGGFDFCKLDAYLEYLLNSGFLYVTTNKRYKVA